MCAYCSHALHEKILDLDIIIIACFAAAWDHWYTSTLTIYVHGVGPLAPVHTTGLLNRVSQPDRAHVVRF